MTTDITMLVLTAVLSLVWPMVYVVGRMQAAGGMQWAFGNRDTSLETPAWVDRAVRTHQNMTENLAPFAILVLAAAVTGTANAQTALGATIFFYARIAHAVVYTLGIPGLRTAVFFVGAAGEVMILMQLF